MKIKYTHRVISSLLAALLLSTVNSPAAFCDCADKNEPPQCPGDSGSCPPPECPPDSSSGDDSTQSSGGCASCGGAAASGMPRYRISEPAINLRLEDTPLSWPSPRGRPIEFRLAYRQRGEATEYSYIFGVGNNWTCSLRTYLQEDTSGNISLQINGGELIDYTLGVNQFLDGSLLTTTNSGATYQITYRDGSVRYFTYTFSVGENTYYFVTAYSDPAGNTITYNYTTTASPIVLLTSVQDPANNTISIYYEDTVYSNQITRVVAPNGRTNYLSYDDSIGGYLTNVVDVIGLTNIFQYDAGNPGWITNLVQLRRFCVPPGRQIGSHIV